MSPPARAIRYGLLLLLTGIALFFGSGCYDSPFDLGPISNSTVAPFLLGFELWNVCVPVTDVPGRYTRYTVAVGPNGSTNDIAQDDTSQRSDCDYSVGTQAEVDPSAAQASFGQTSTSAPGPPSGGQAQPRAASSGQHPVNALPYARPLPFVPAFSAGAGKTAPIMCDPNGSFYAVNHGNSLVTHFAACSLSVISTIPVAANPLHPATTPDGSLLLVTSYNNAVNFISTATDTVVFTLQTPNVYPSGIAISPDGSTAYVTNYYNANPEVIVINIASRTITGAIPLPLPYPKQIFLTPDGAQAWVNFYASSQIYIIDTFSQTVSSLFNVGNLATTGIAFNATGTNAYVAAEPSDLMVFDTATLNRIADIQVGTYPVDVVLTPDAARIYVTSFMSSTISIVDAHTNQLMTNVTAPGVDQRAFTLIPLVP